MERTDVSGGHADGTFDQLISQEVNENSTTSEQDTEGSDRTCWRYRHPAAVSLALLAIVLLATDIGLGLHYQNLTDTRRRLHDIDLIGAELHALEDSYQGAVQVLKDVQKELSSERNLHQEPNWELEHQLKTSAEYEAQVAVLHGDIGALITYLRRLSDGCKLCPPGWIFMHSMCYYFPFPPYLRPRSWNSARSYCMIYGGDLAIVDSKEKENSTVKHLAKNTGIGISEMELGFWIGLVRNNEGGWKWVDGRELVERYWADGEQYRQITEACAAVNPTENFFKAWNTQRCSENRKWICEKTPSL